jgi:2,4'-dihydroxyacetophenone dioxygenase
MPEAPTTEPWKGTQPVPHAMRPGALPEAYMAKIAEGDERLWVPIGRPQVEDVFSKPVWISPTLNMWADVLMAKKPCIVNRHYHPKPIWAYTISGKWAYLEHDWTATAGDFIFETPGESHTLVTEHPDGVKLFGWMEGPIEFYDENAVLVETADVWWMMNHYESYCREQNIPINPKLYL